MPTGLHPQTGFDQLGGMPELLELPLRDSSLPSVGVQGESSQAREINGEEWFSRPGLMLADLVLSIVFWYVMLFAIIPDKVVYAGLLVFPLCMVLWRVWLSLASGGQDEAARAKVPYTTGVISMNGREMFLVATVHISPRAPKDVEAVINITDPDVVMIELDEERLGRMRDDEATKRREPRQEDLQPVRIAERDKEDPVTVYGQRALWNAEWAGQAFSGDLVFDEDDPYGMSPSSKDLGGRISLVHRGGAEGEFAPFALKAHRAANAGAAAVLVINTVGPLPVNRIGSATLMGDLRVFLQTCRCGFPPVPVLLLPHEDGTRLCEKAKQEGVGSARVEFEMLDDTLPRRTLRKRLCQSFALIFSGIGILYGVIQCFAVEVGGEFLAAESVATKKRIPCVCIDVDLDRFWSRIGWALLPTPANLGKSLLAWLAFPRVLFLVFFPPRGNVDIVGCSLLHAWSFPLRTWVAFFLAGFCASFVTSNILNLFSSGAEKAAESSGAVEVDSEEDRDILQSLILLAVESYMMPRIYEAIAASRDEAMYQSIIARSHDQNARRMVVVVGAGHANGILQRARSRGL